MNALLLIVKPVAEQNRPSYRHTEIFYNFVEYFRKNSGPKVQIDASDAVNYWYTYVYVNLDAIL